MTVTATPSMPLAAVYTPVYNGDKYLEETMACVQAQTYPNLVHVVLDNASTDRTAEIIAQFSDQRVPVIAHRNDTLLDLGDNWNRSATLTPEDAKYIRLLCADDLMTPDFMEKTIALAERDPDLLLVGTNVSKNDTPFDMMWPEGTDIMEGKEVIRNFLTGDFGFFAIHTLMRRSVLDWRPELFDKDLLAMDVDFVLGIMMRGRFGMVHDRLGWVREHETTLTSTVMRKRNTHYGDFLTLLYRYGPDVFSPAEFRALRSRFESYYLRKMRRWRIEQGEDAIQHHLESFERVRGPVRPSDWLNAVYDRIMIKLKLHQPWTGWPN